MYAHKYKYTWCMFFFCLGDWITNENNYLIRKQTFIS